MDELPRKNGEEEKAEEKTRSMAESAPNDSRACASCDRRQRTSDLIFSSRGKAFFPRRRERQRGRIEILIDIGGCRLIMQIEICKRERFAESFSW